VEQGQEHVRTTWVVNADETGWAQGVKAGRAARAWLWVVASALMVVFRIAASDAWSESWDLRGAAQDVQLLYELGRELASSDRWPQWKPGSEFKEVHNRSAAARQKAEPTKVPAGQSVPGR
jgi:hypothetical protein